MKSKASANKYKEEVNILTLLLVIGIILFVLFLAGLLRGFALRWLVYLALVISRSNSHNDLAATGDIQGPLAIPAFKQVFTPQP